MTLGEWYDETIYEDFNKYNNTEKLSNVIELRDWQKKAKQFFFEEAKGKCILEISTGGGKCFKKGTEIIMYDGSIKKIEDIKIGDKLMGDDSEPRTVTSLSTGKEMMYDVIPVKGDKYTVNESHILSLKYTGLYNYKKLKDGTTKIYIGKNNKKKIDIPLLEYLKKNKKEKHVLKGYRVPVEFKEQKLDVDPYYIGLWLGDGTASTTTISNPDREIINYLKNLASKNGYKLHNYSNETKCDQWNMTLGRLNGGKNMFLDLLRKYNLLNNKHIPKKFLINSRENRLQLLAGLLDTDGSITKNQFEITQKSKQLSEDILFLARSLGFAAHISEKIGVIKKTNFKGLYYRIYISGDCSIIPTKIKRKQANKRQQKKDVLVTGIKVEPVGEDTYYGFTITGNNRRFLLKDFTVVHNTYAAIDIISDLMKKEDIRALIIVPKNVILETGWYTELTNYGMKIQDIGVYYGATKEYAKITITNMQSVHRIPLDMFNVLVADELHNYNSKRMMKIINHNFKYKLGLTATLKRLDGGHTKLLKSFNYNIYKYTAKEALEDDVLNPFDFYNIGLHINPETREKYDELTQTLNSIFQQSGSFQYIMRTQDPIKFKLLSIMNERKQLINNYKDKFLIAKKIISQNKDKKIIVFNQYNDQTNKLYWHLLDEEIKCRIIHSGIDQKQRDINLVDFKNNKFNVLLTSKVLDEGFNIPKLDLAIIMAGDSTDKQTIQRMGRVLRKQEGKQSKLYQIFCIDTMEHKNANEKAKVFKSLASTYKDYTYYEDEDFQID